MPLDAPLSYPLTHDSCSSAYAAPNPPYPFILWLRHACIGRHTYTPRSVTQLYIFTGQSDAKPLGMMVDKTDKAQQIVRPSASNRTAKRNIASIAHVTSCPSLCLRATTHGSLNGE